MVFLPKAQHRGPGDRLQQTVDGLPVNYALDLNAGLTQVLEDGTYSYLYGLDRLAQTSAADEYFLGDALESVRQLADANAALTLAQAYAPYGSPAALAGTGSSMYGFTGEAQDATGLVHLRERYYSPDQGRFLSRDRWPGDPDQPSTLHMWLYALASPMNRTDPSGRYPVEPPDGDGDCVAASGLGLYSFLDFGITSDDLGSWTCQELTHALNEMEQLDAAATVGLSNVFGGEVIPVKRSESDRSCGYYHWTGSIELYRGFADPTRRAEGTLGHELAHRWDAEWNISSKSAAYVGARFHISPWLRLWYDPGDERPPLYGNGDPPSASEDFAESLAEVVYDQGSWERLPSTQKRAQFVGMLLLNGRMLEPANPFDAPNYCMQIPSLNL